MTATRNPQAPADDFEFPAATGGGGEDGPEDEGEYDAVLAAIERPAPSKIQNDRGEYPLTSIFKFHLDDYPGYEQWGYVNVQARGERSTLYKAYLALTGEKLGRNDKLRAADLVGLKCRLTLRRNEAGRMRISDYLRPRKARPEPRRTRIVEDDDELTADAPF